jgi:protein SCO1/2
MNQRSQVNMNVQDQRRRHAFLQGLCGACMAWLAPASMSAHASFGPVDPREALPSMKVSTLEGASVDLASTLKGSVVALQLMYTGCSATCPIQGAMFAQLQQKLSSAHSEVQLVSISIDPRGDDPMSLRAWLRRHGANAKQWRALLPQAQDVDRLQAVLKGRSTGADRHTPQVYVLDRQGRLMYRTGDMPSADAVFSLLQAVSARA